MAQERAMKTIRSAAVILKENQLLLVKHQKNGEVYYVLPGGHVDAKEALDAAAVREVKEECNVEIAIDKLLYVGDFLERDTLDVVFKATYVSGDLSNDHDPDKQYGVIAALEWINTDAVHELDLRPGKVKDILLQQLSSAFDPQYLGPY